MANLTETLNLTKISYTAKHIYSFDEENNVWIGQVNNPDLTIVFKNSDKAALERDIKSAIAMHCYMFSMDAIDKSLNLNKYMRNKAKASVNILVPCVA